jgi:inorganic phosphate transporter, PiT family
VPLLLLATLDSLPTSSLILLGLALTFVFAFEFVNGFHDTANAVATVIYTNTLRPWVAVIWSGICNFAGVFFGGIAVAYAIVHLLPVDLLVDINTRAGMAMVFALLTSAILWNFGTWYVALPASSSHSLIGSILGVGLANSMIQGKFGAGVNWRKAQEVALSLIVSPLFGFVCAAFLLLAIKKLVNKPVLFTAPKPDTPPPFWTRVVLIFTCTGVSLAHGSNDGQKGVGMAMLILIGLLPASYALDLEASPKKLSAMIEAAERLDDFLCQPGAADHDPSRHSGRIREILSGKASLAEVEPGQRWELRSVVLHLDADARDWAEKLGPALSPKERADVKSWRKGLIAPTEYAPTWVLLAVALSLGIGTMIGWKRIVVTVGEKIGTSHLTYAQGASAELVAMSTIGLAVFGGLPVSTTHVLSSAVAGTMVANRSGLQLECIRKIALAWILTLPATMFLAGGFLIFFRLFTG